MNLPKTIKKGDTVTFNYPIIISKDIARQIIEENAYENAYVIATDLLVIIGQEGYSKLKITYNKETDNMQITDTVTFSDDEGNEGIFVLQRDSFFHNLITGFKYNGEENFTIEGILSSSALRYTKMKFINSAEINKLKKVISESGQIEKTIDVNGTWFTLKELTDYAKSLIIQDVNEVNSVILQYDKNPNLQIGNLINICLPEFYTEGYYAVKKIQYEYENELEQTWTITIQKSSLLNNYIDIFRPTQKQETEEQNESIIISEFIEEKINERHNVEEVKNES